MIIGRTPPIYILNRCILSIYILNRYIFVFDLPAVLSFKNRPNHHGLRFSHFSHNTLFVGLLFYITARAHRHKGRKLRFQEAQRRRHTGNSSYSNYCTPLYILNQYWSRSASRLRPQDSTKSPRFKFFPSFPQHSVCGSSCIHPCKSTQTQR